MTANFTSEDDLATFEGWLKYQCFDPSTMTQEELTSWRTEFDKT
jgi:hypothetical protein